MITFKEYLVQNYPADVVVDVINTALQEMTYWDERYYINVIDLITDVGWGGVKTATEIINAGISKDLTHGFEPHVFFVNGSDHLEYCRVEDIPVSWDNIERWMSETNYDGLWGYYINDCTDEDQV